MHLDLMGGSEAIVKIALHWRDPPLPMEDILASRILEQARRLAWRWNGSVCLADRLIQCTWATYWWRRPHARSSSSSVFSLFRLRNPLLSPEALQHPRM